MPSDPDNSDLSHLIHRRGADSDFNDEPDGWLDGKDDVKTDDFQWTNLLSLRYLIVFLWSTLHRLTFFTISIILILWASAFIYASFYYVYVPTVSYTKSINFQFDTLCDEACTAPFAELNLISYKSSNMFSRGQQYKIRIEMNLPESDINWNQGIFMTRLKLLDANANVALNVARSTILQYKSPLLRIVYLIFYWPVLVTGFKQETQKLVVPLVDDYIDGINPNSGPAYVARIELEARQIQVYSGTLIIQANLTGLRYCMFYWPIITAVFGIGTITVFLSILTALSIYKILASTNGDNSQDLDNELAGLANEADYSVPDTTQD